MEMKNQKPYGELGLMDFQVLFPNENTCWQYLSKMRWSKGLACAKCQSERIGWIKTRRLYHCRVCRWQMSVTAGTTFHRSRISLRKWFWAIWWMATSKKGSSALNLQRQLGLGSYRAAWLMAHKIRRAMINREDLYQLKGTVEIDEIHVGGKQPTEKLIKMFDKPRFLKSKTPLLMAVEETATGRPRYARVEGLPNKTSEGIWPVIEKRIAKGSTLKSDGAGVYKGAAEKGYVLDSSSYNRSPYSTREHLQWVNTLTANLKRFLLGTHHSVHPKYRKAYAAEFAYRFNRRYWPKEAFDRLLYACLQNEPVPLKAIKGPGPKIG